jgi:hypothetical protein
VWQRRLALQQVAFMAGDQGSGFHGTVLSQPSVRILAPASTFPNQASRGVTARAHQAPLFITREGEVTVWDPQVKRGLLQ